MTILILSAIIITFQAVDVLMLAKDTAMFEEFKKLAENATVDDYIVFHLMNFFRGIIVPVILSIYTFLGREKLRIGKLYKVIFGGLILLTIINSFIGHHFKTILFYGTLAVEIILFFYIINLTEEETDGKI